MGRYKLPQFSKMPCITVENIFDQTNFINVQATYGAQSYNKIKSQLIIPTIWQSRVVTTVDSSHGNIKLLNRESSQHSLPWNEILFSHYSADCRECRTQPRFLDPWPISWKLQRVFLLFLNCHIQEKKKHLWQHVCMAVSAEYTV